MFSIIQTIYLNYFFMSRQKRYLNTVFISRIVCMKDSYAYKNFVVTLLRSRLFYSEFFCVFYDIFLHEKYEVM